MSGDSFSTDGDPFGAGSLPADVPLVGGAVSAPLRRSRPWLALVSAAAVVLVIGGGALALRAFLNTSVAASQVAPPDTEIFVSIDFLQLIEGDARKLNDTIISMIESTGEVDGDELRDVDGMIAEIDAALEEALGVDFSDDMRPWLGRTVSLAVSGIAELSTFDLAMDPGEVLTFDDAVATPGRVDIPEVVLLVESRDPSAADSFLADFADGLARATGADVATASYEGVDLYIASDEAEFDPPLVFGRIGSVVAFGTRAAVEGAIDAGSGLSLADDAVFTEAMASLPDNRFASLYVSGSIAQEALAAQSLDPVDYPAYEFDALAGSMSIAEYGIRFDSVVLGDDPTGGVELDPAGVVADLPVDTMVMFGGWSVASYWDALEAVLGDEADQMLAEGEAELGIDLRRFISLLDRSSAIALVETRDGLMAAELGYPLGLLGAFGTSDPNQLLADVDHLADYLHGSGVEGMVRREVAGGAVWVFDPGDGEAVTVGVVEEYLVAASSRSLAVGLGGQPSLAENERLQAVAAVMGVAPESVMVFVDTQRLVQVFEPPRNVHSALAPLGPMAASYETSEGRAMGTLVWLIDYVEGG